MWEQMKFYLRVIRAIAGHSENKERLGTVRVPDAAYNVCNVALAYSSEGPAYGMFVARLHLTSTCSTVLSPDLATDYLRNISRCHEFSVLCVISPEECVSISDR